MRRFRVFAVCDGMGGEADGDFASLTAVTTLAEHVKAIKSAAANAEPEKTRQIHAAVRKFAADANNRLCSAMSTRRVRMGTTLVLVVIAKDTVYPYNLGDSRIYAHRFSKGLFRVSKDHTLAAQKVEMGILTEEEAGRDRGRHVLTQYLGVFEDEITVVPAAAEPLPFNENCRLLLCSDGLTEMVADARIEEILRAFPNAGDAAERLLTEALGNGGRDNVTCVVVDAIVK